MSWITDVERFYHKLRLVIPPGKPIAILVSILAFLKAKRLKRPVLRGVDIVTNYSCNLPCVHCNIHTMKQRQAVPLSLDEYRAIERQCTALGVFQYTFTGGEPLLRHDLEELVKVFKPYKRVMLLQTNGKLITSLDKAVWLKKIGIDIVNVSLDSGIPEEHDATRGLPGHYADTVRAIELCKRAGLRTMIGTVLTHQNVRSRGIRSLLEYCEANRVLLVLNLAAPVGKWHDNREILLTRDDQDYIRRLTAAHPLASLDIEATINAYGCPAFKEKLYVTPYGDVTGCTFVQISFGNVRETPLREIRDLALGTNLMNEYSPRCYAAEDANFIEKYMSQLGGTVPKHYRDVVRDTAPLRNDRS